MTVDVKIVPSWKDRLYGEFDQPYFTQLIEFVKTEYRTQTIYPPGKEIFRAFDVCDFNALKVVIIGQGPLPRTRPGQRIVFLRPPGCENAAIPGKYLQRDSGRPGKTLSRQWGPWSAGHIRVFCCSMLP